MKTLKSLINFILVGAAATLIMACSSTDPQVIVVTATPTATPRAFTVAPNLAVTPEPTIVELTVKPEASSQTTPVYRTGTLLEGSNGEIFYITEDGARQQFYNRETFLAYGFSEKQIIAVDNETLKAIPLAGVLTRLAADNAGNLYWVALGQRWQVNEWKQAGEHTGLLSALWDSSLWQTIPAQKDFEPGTLLRANNTTYYFEQGIIVPLVKEVGPQARVIDIPAQMLAAYIQKSQLDQAQLELNPGIPAANVRQNPSLEAKVLGAVEKGNKLTIQGRTSNNAWLQIDYQGQPGWIAADLVEQSIAVSLLPVAAKTDLPKAEPAAVVEISTPTPQPVHCTDVPIRGFGKVWGDYPEVKNTLGCSDSWQGGEKATQAAVQLFQNGLMVWLQADGFYSGDPVWVFFNDGTYQRFGELGPVDSAKVSAIPVGFYEIGARFDKVYWEGTGAQVKERLGYAIAPATDTAGAFQQFSNGRMFWTEALDRIFVIYEYGYFDETNTYIQVRTWQSYEDKF